MKRVFVFVLICCSCLSFFSCSSFEPKEIYPTSTEFVSGELAEYIEVVDEPCVLSFREKKGSFKTQYIRLEVRVRLAKESLAFQKVDDPRNISFTSLLSVATIILKDDFETEVNDIAIQYEELLKLKKLLQKEEGDEEILVFEGEFHNPKGARSWFKDTEYFTPYLTGDIMISDEAENQTVGRKGASLQEVNYRTFSPII